MSSLPAPIRELRTVPRLDKAAPILARISSSVTFALT
jgi:hypothetical protein